MSPSVCTEKRPRVVSVVLGGITPSLRGSWMVGFGTLFISGVPFVESKLDNKSF